MERRSFLGALGAAAIPLEAFAQSGTLSSSVVATQLKISSFTILSPTLGAPSASIGLSVQTAGGVETASKSVSIPNALAPTLTVGTLITAMMTTRATETGSNAQKMSFRVIGELFDKGALPELVSVTP